MKKTKNAIKYGIETLKVSPDKMFSLIESSRDYDGEDYPRWLASKIIDLAEKEGVGFSQLLVKKFNILTELAEEDMENGVGGFKDDYLSLFKRLLNEEENVNFYTVGFPEISGCGSLDGIDWFSGIDYDDENSYFVHGLLGTCPESEELFTNIVKGGADLNLLIKLTNNPVDKKSDLFIESKSRGVSCTTEGALMLYRMCCIYDIFQTGKFAFFCPVDFLYSNDNKEVIKYLERRFKVKGINVHDFSTSVFSCGSYAYCVCSAKENFSKEGIYLKTVEFLVGEELLLSKKSKLYSQIDTPMLNVLSDTYKDLMVDKVPLEENGVIIGETDGCKNAFGYLCYNSDVVVSSNPIKNHLSIPITKKSIYDIIVYYSLVKSRKEMGLYVDIPYISNGSTKYSELLYNCLPIFLFDFDSIFSGIEGGNLNYFELGGDLVTQLLDKGEVYFSFETKEFFNACKLLAEGIADYGKVSFSDLLDKCDRDLYNVYLTSLRSLKDYICQLYRGLY